MKGKLTKTEQGWVVRYRETTPLSITTETLPLHPDSGIPQDAMCNVLDYGFAEVDFEIVNKLWGVNDDVVSYAKLINQSFIDNRKDKLEILAKLLAKTWFYCDWKWESPNERVMQMLMQDLGLYPFKDEDEAIQQTQVDDELYREASRRVPTYGKLSEDLVENKLDLSKIKQKLDETLANETSESLTEWMNGKREDDVEKLAVEEYPIFDGDLLGIAYNQKQSRIDFIKGYNKAKETLYTKQDIIDSVNRMYDIFMDDTLEAKKLRLKGISWHIQNTLNHLNNLKNENNKRF
jgi:hypothetical protein